MQPATWNLMLSRLWKKPCVIQPLVCVLCWPSEGPRPVPDLIASKLSVSTFCILHMQLHSSLKHPYGVTSTQSWLPPSGVFQAAVPDTKLPMSILSS